MNVDYGEILKQPPHSRESEQSLLGGLMQGDATAWDRIVGKVDAMDFYIRAHRLVFESMGALALAGGPIDIVTVFEALRIRGVAEDVGGLAYLSQLALDTPSSANVQRYAEIVREKSIERDLLQVGSRIGDIVFGPSTTREKLDACQREVMSITEARQQGGPERAATILVDVWMDLKERMENGRRRGASTSLVDLDASTGGLAPGDLVVVAARPGMGKSALAGQIAESLALDGLAAAVFSLEMSRQQFIARSLAGLARISHDKVRDATLSPNEVTGLGTATELLETAPLYIDDTPALSVDEIAARSRSLHRQNPLSLIAVDYLQLMEGQGDNRTQAIESITRRLKALAKELDVPVIALSQLNRSCEARMDKRPLLSDLRESGGIEQDADVVIMLYRDDYYDEFSIFKGIAELIVRKHRHGRVGTVYTTFIGELLRFENFAGPLPQAQERVNRRRVTVDD